MEVGLMRDGGSFLVMGWQCPFWATFVFRPSWTHNALRGQSEVTGLAVVICSLQDLLTCPVLKEGVNHSK